VSDSIIRNENKALVIRSLVDGRKTIKQLASATGLSERAVRSVTDELKQDKYILPSGYHNRSVIWRVNSATLGIAEGSGRLPYHDVKASHTSSHLVDIAWAGMMKSSMLPPPDTVTKVDYYTRSMYPLLAELLGEMIKPKPDQEIIDEVRSQLIQAYKVMGSTVDLLKDIIKTDEYWKADSLKKLSDAQIVKNSADQIAEFAKVAKVYRMGDTGGPSQ